jgi:hypothetical protein
MADESEMFQSQVEEMARRELSNQKIVPTGRQSVRGGAAPVNAHKPATGRKKNQEKKNSGRTFFEIKG